MPQTRLASLVSPIFFATCACILFSIFALVRGDSAPLTTCEVNMETVKLDVAGMHLNIPLGHFYIDGFIKHGRWPSPSRQRVLVKSVNIDFLLPDLTALSCENVDLLSAESRPFPYLSVVLGASLPEARGWFDKIQQRIADGIRVEDGTRGRFKKYREGNVTYYMEDGLTNFMITCRNYEDRDSCLVKDEYKYGYYLEYFTDSVHIFQKPISIIDEIRKKIIKFEQDAN